MLILRGVVFRAETLIPPKSLKPNPGSSIPCEITRVTSGRAFCNTKRRDCLQNDVFVFFQLCSNIENHLSKKFRPYKMAWLEEHNFIPSHQKAMSKTKMTKHQITTKWHYWNVPILEKLLGHKWLGSETKPWDPTQWLYWMIPNSIHIALKLLLKSGG